MFESEESLLNNVEESSPNKKSDEPVEVDAFDDDGDDTESTNLEDDFDEDSDGAESGSDKLSKQYQAAETARRKLQSESDQLKQQVKMLMQEVQQLKSMTTPQDDEFESLDLGPDEYLSKEEVKKRLKENAIAKKSQEGVKELADFYKRIQPREEAKLEFVRTHPKRDKVFQFAQELDKSGGLPEEGRRIIELGDPLVSYLYLQKLKTERILRTYKKALDSKPGTPPTTVRVGGGKPSKQALSSKSAFERQLENMARKTDQILNGV